MTISAIETDPRVADVSFTETHLVVALKDGREVSVPLFWFPRLAEASNAERAQWESCAAGHGIHWPTIDEDLSVEGLLRGTPAV